VKTNLDRYYKTLNSKMKRFYFKYFSNFIFIHINKTGGTSIERALDLPFKHYTALEKIEEIGRAKWNSKYTFCIVRNPWDKVISHYHYRLQTNQINLWEKPVDFSEWTKLSYGQQNPLYYDKPKMFMPQSDWITDENGTILVNFIGKFENLQGDFDKICERLKRKKTILPHIKSSSRANYREYYDEETAEIVENWFRKDIENFGYKF
jgi:chondroitin 4-sulfotransferase 11